MEIERDGVRLAWEEAGSGEPTVLLVHGWATDRRSLRPLLDRLRARHRVVAVDLRGFGESAAPAQAYTMEGYADDLAFVAERSGLRRSIVIGHSMGGLVALAFAARHPARVAKAVVLEALVGASEAQHAGLRKMLDGVRGEDRRDFLARLFAHLVGSRFDPVLRASMVELAAACPRHVLESSLEGMLAFDSLAAAAQVKSPLLYVGTATPYADLARLREVAPHVVVEHLAECGHYFPLEAPAELHARLLPFLEGRRAVVT